MKGNSGFHNFILMFFLFFFARLAARSRSNLLGFPVFPCKTKDKAGSADESDEGRSYWGLISTQLIITAETDKAVILQLLLRPDLILPKTQTPSSLLSQYNSKKSYGFLRKETIHTRHSHQTNQSHQTISPLRPSILFKIPSC